MVLLFPQQIDEFYEKGFLIIKSILINGTSRTFKTRNG